MPQNKIRMAVIGGRRGGNFGTALEHLRDRVTLTAVCDIRQEMLDKWTKDHPGIRTYTDYDKMIADDVCDAVFIATPMQIHADQAITAMRAGKHVVSEVTACVTHDEAVRLVEAVEQTGMTYMMAENYTYRRPHMMIQNMVDRGVFGELTYAEGMYIHDCRMLKFNDDGSLTWRGELARDMPLCNYYPTHSFGPIAQWLGIGKDDAIDTVYCAGTRGLSMADYANRRFGKDHPGADASYWQRGDGANCLITTAKGRLVHLRTDTSSTRPHHMFVHELQGTDACYRTTEKHDDEPCIWIHGQSPAEDIGGFPEATEWDKLFKYADEFEHPRWKAQGETALKAGHGGGDFFVMEDFINAVTGEAPNPIDIYEAVAWSSLIWLSQESARTRRAVKAIDYRTAAAR